MLVCSLTPSSENVLSRNKASFPYKFVESRSSPRQPLVVTKIRSGGAKGENSENTKLEITCQKGSTMMLNSLRPYVYNSGSSDDLDCYIEDQALLLICQHPTKVHSSSCESKNFTKRQTFNVHGNSSLVSVDWFDYSEKSMNGEAVAIDSLVEVKMDNVSILSLIDQEQVKDNY